MLVGRVVLLVVVWVWVGVRRLKGWLCVVGRGVGLCLGGIVCWC